MILPESIQSLINALERLPGIGPKSASRLAFYLLRASEDVAQDLSVALANLKVNTAFCQECFNITEAGRERCEICESPKREDSLICVVEEALDVLALERTAGFHGKYHVLQGVMSPIEGVGPDDLKKAKSVLESFDLILLVEWMQDDTQITALNAIFPGRSSIAPGVKLKGDVSMKTKLHKKLAPDEVWNSQFPNFMIRNNMHLG